MNRRLKCPNCSAVVVVSAGETPVCSDCGYDDRREGKRADHVQNRVAGADPRRKDFDSAGNLFPCPDCLQEVSRRANVCIHCGAPLGSASPIRGNQLGTSTPNVRAAKSGVLANCGQCGTRARPFREDGTVAGCENCGWNDKPTGTLLAPQSNIQLEVDRIKATKAARQQIRAETATANAEAKKGVTMGPWIVVGIGVFFLISATLPQQVGYVQFLGGGEPIEVDCGSSRWSGHEACNESKVGTVVLSLAIIGAGSFWLHSRLKT